MSNYKTARFIFIIVTLLFLIPIVFQIILSTSDPIYQASIQTDKIGERFYIERSEIGISTLHPNHPSHVYFGLGFLHAQDRLVQVELKKHKVHGKLSLVVDSSYLNSDKYYATVDILSISDSIMGKLNQEIIYNLQSYAEGYNLYLEEFKHKFPIEWLSLRLPFELLTIREILAMYIDDMLTMNKDQWLKSALIELKNNDGTISNEKIELLSNLLNIYENTKIQIWNWHFSENENNRYVYMKLYENVKLPSMYYPVNSQDSISVSQLITLPGSFIPLIVNNKHTTQLIKSSSDLLSIRSLKSTGKINKYPFVIEVKENEPVKIDIIKNGNYVAFTSNQDTIWVTINNDQILKHVLTNFNWVSENIKTSMDVNSLNHVHNSATIQKVEKGKNINITDDLSNKYETIMRDTLSVVPEKPFLFNKTPVENVDNFEILLTLYESTQLKKVILENMGHAELPNKAHFLKIWQGEVEKISIGSFILLAIIQEIMSDLSTIEKIEWQSQWLSGTPWSVILSDYLKKNKNKVQSLVTYFERSITKLKAVYGDHPSGWRLDRKVFLEIPGYPFAQSLSVNRGPYLTGEQQLWNTNLFSQNISFYPTVRIAWNLSKSEGNISWIGGTSGTVQSEFYDNILKSSLRKHFLPISIDPTKHKIVFLPL